MAGMAGTKHGALFGPRRSGVKVISRIRRGI